jgi:D-alanine-D-alanine ligase
MTEQADTNFGRVAVLMGGDSAEREVSLKSGEAALKALKNKGVDAFGLDLRLLDKQNNVCEQLSENAFDTAFIALHGRGGEDGVVQGLLEAMNIPYTGCRVAASAIGMDKLRTKQLWSGSGLPTPTFRLIKAEQLMAVNEQETEALMTELSDSLGFPLMIKPAHEGSSIGMSKVDSTDELFSALTTAAKYDEEIVVETWVVGKEYTGGVLNGQALPLIRLETPRSFYDYQAKYLTDDTLYHCPCGLSQTMESQYQELIIKAFECVGASGWGRVDFMCDENDQPWLIEINTVPGLTDHSLVPMAAKQDGIGFDDLIYKILETANVTND